MLYTKQKQDISGKVILTILNNAGEEVEHIEISNRIPDIGLNMIARYFAGDGGFPIAALSHLAVGTGSTAAAALDTTLETEISRVVIDTQGSVTDTATLTGEFSGAAVEGVNINEFGVFNDPTTGDMLARIVLASPITLPVGFTMQVQWDIVFSYTQADPKKVFTTLGINAAADLLVGGATVPISHIAIGTGVTDPLPGDTTLETETARSALDSINVANGLVTHIATFAGPLANIAEQGGLNAGAAGTLMNRLTYIGLLNLPAGNTQLTLVTEFVYGGV